MGREVFPIKGNIDFYWKFVFGIQPSDFGEFMEDAIGANRYVGSDGEVVYIGGDRDVIIEALEDYIEKFSPGKYDREMIKKFIETLRKSPKVVDGWLFVEY